MRKEGKREKGRSRVRNKVKNGRRKKDEREDGVRRK
jgi:hypothetical protein